MYFPEIISQNSSFSSNRKAKNSELSFQFMTPGRELAQKSMKPMKFQNFYLQKTWNSDPAIYFRNEKPKFDKINTERHKFPAISELHSLTPSSAQWKEVALHSFEPFAHPNPHFKTISLILSKFTTSYSIKCTKWPLCSKTTAEQTNLHKMKLKTKFIFQVEITNWHIPDACTLVVADYDEKYLAQLHYLELLKLVCTNVYIFHFQRPASLWAVV